MYCPGICTRGNRRWIASLSGVWTITHSQFEWLGRGVHYGKCRRVRQPEKKKGHEGRKGHPGPSLPLEFEPQADALRPEVGGPVQRGRASRAGWRHTKRDTGDVHNRINLVAGADHLAP